MREYKLPESLKEKLKLDEPIKMRNKIKKELEELLVVNISDETFSNILTMCMMEDARESISKDLEKAAENYCKSTLLGSPSIKKSAFKAGANWQKQNLWKDAQGDELPEIDREVIALQGRRVVFAHRPIKYTKVWNEDLGEHQIIEAMTYDKGGWNMKGVTYWLDAPLPEGIE